jgi:hypothetical protein
VTSSPLNLIEQARRQAAIDELVNRIATSSGDSDEW